jgi:hypothetical protein
MPHDPDTLAQRAFEAFYAALGMPHASWGWAHLRPAVQAAWRRVVAVVREAGEEKQDDV